LSYSGIPVWRIFREPERDFPQFIGLNSPIEIRNDLLNFVKVTNAITPQQLHADVHSFSQLAISA